MIKKIVLFLIILNVMICSCYSINITTCQGLSAGNDYLLTQDIYNNSGVCFSFNGDNITIDCDGYTVDGIKDAPLISVAGRNNITVKNCNLRQGTNGITYNGGSYFTLLNTNITDMANTGLDIIFNSDNHYIDNVIIDTVVEHGIHLDAGSGTECDDSLFYNIEIYNAQGNGITWEVGKRNEFINITIINTDRGISAGTIANSYLENIYIENSTLDYGVYITQTGNNIEWNGLTILNTQTIGFRCDYISSNTLCDNSIFRNLVIDGVTVSNGLMIERSDNITVDGFVIKNIGDATDDNAMILSGNNAVGHIIKNGFINNSAGNCLEIEDSGANSILNNITISNCGQFGVMCDDVNDNNVCDGSILKNINISYCDNDGMFLQETNNVELINISSRFNGDDGLTFTSSPNNIVSFSNFLNNSGYGIRLINSNNITVYGTLIGNITSDNWALDSFWNNTIDNVSLGNYWVDFNNCTNSTFFVLGVYEYEVCLSHDYVIDQVNNVIDYDPIVSIMLFSSNETGNETGDNETPVIVSSTSLTDTTGQLPAVGTHMGGFINNSSPAIVKFVFIITIILLILGLFTISSFVIKDIMRNQN